MTSRGMKSCGWLLSLGFVSLVGCHSSGRGTSPGAAEDAGRSEPRPMTGHRTPRDGPGSVSSAEAAPVPPAPPEPEALAGPPLRDLQVEGFRAAVASAPLGATGRRPVVIALHGNYDRPEWQCSVWRDITGGYPWVLCPRGTPRGDAPREQDRWTYGAAKALEAEIAAGLAALNAAYPQYVEPRLPVLAGFSLGAILGVHLLSRKSPESNYRAAVLVEGGYKGWNHASAKAFAAQGGKRVLFACGQSACNHASQQAANVLKKHGVEVEVVSGGNVGHTYDAAVADAIAGKWSWLTVDDDRFVSIAPEAPAAP